MHIGVDNIREKTLLEILKGEFMQDILRRKYKGIKPGECIVKDRPDFMADLKRDYFHLNII